MLGAVIGDIIGSLYEGEGKKGMDLPFFAYFKDGDYINDFTDDTVLTVAIAESILDDIPYAQNIKEFALEYPGRGYGNMFLKWMYDDKSKPYNSYGNGSGMRVSPISFAFDSLEKVLEEAKKSAEITHNHPEGIKGAQAIASAGFLARQGKSKPEIRQYIQNTFAYDMNRTIESIRPNNKFTVICQETVPESIIAFLDSHDFESAIRLAISIGGDTDTIAAMAGGIAQSYYQYIPQNLINISKKVLNEYLWEVIERFNEKYQIRL